jgi:succinyl-CoA synthetase alpha subunit
VCGSPGIRPRRNSRHVGSSAWTSRATRSAGFVPPAFVKAAVVEAADAGIGLAVVITEGIPVHGTVTFTAYAKEKGTQIIAPTARG